MRLPHDDLMRLLPGLSFAVVVQLAVTAVIAAPVDTLLECAARAAPATEGLAALQQQCPGLEPAMSDLGYSTLLSGAWQRRLTPGGLADLAALAQSYLPDKRASGPDVAPVRGIVDALAREQSPALSGWDAFKAWLRSLFQRKGDRSLSWLDRWLDNLATAAGVMTFVLYGLLLAVLVLAAAFIVGELHAAGVLSRRRRSDAPAVLHESASLDGSECEAMLDAVPLVDRPAILLQLLVNGLSRKGRLRADRHLTHRELIGRAVLDDGTQRARFARVANLAEGLLYGPKPRSMEGLESIISEGRLLLSQIDRLSTAA
jgi:hypothetical protein